jgi:hypothetical protein
MRNSPFKYKVFVLNVSTKVDKTFTRLPHQLGEMGGAGKLLCVDSGKLNIERFQGTVHEI